MNTKALKILEYDKVIEMLVKHATCDPGRNICRNLLPSSDIEKIQNDIDETAAASSRITAKGRLSLGDVKDIGSCIRRLDVHGDLSMSELLWIARLLSNTNRAIKYGKHEKEDEAADALDGYFAGLDDIPTLYREISHCIETEETMYDDASSELKNIRRQKKNIQDKMHSELNTILNTYRNYLMDAVIAIRDGSYCLPVKTEHKAKVPGIIHDQSSTGSTIFVEPMAVIKMNNDLKELEAKEKVEIARILSELSEAAYPCRDTLKSNLKLLSQLDFALAKASLAGEMKAEIPTVNSDGIIELKKARHPLLNKSLVVPIDISLGKDYELLVITGPNTGGKTVSLKTVGLLTLMAQAGLMIPAWEGSKVSVFDEVFADIGDEQSIEQSLSTFSGHMKNIVQIVEKADDKSLCLFDELGAGTDPTEGAALAISVLDYLHGKGVRTMATTHYSELKVYALTTAGVENASCEFDVETLRPTYRILTGIPGKSNAFAISKKLGLPQHIIDDAGKHIEKNDAQFEDLIAKLNEERNIIEKDKLEIEANKREIEQLKKRHQATDENLDERKEKILRKAREEAQQILSQAKETADETIRNINKITSDSGLGRELEKERERLRKELKNVEGSMGIKVKATPAANKDKPLELKKGDKVHVISMNLDGIVSTLPNDKGYFFVQMGILRSQVHIGDVALLQEAEDISAAKKTGSGFSGGMRTSIVSREINVIGKNVDEACAELDKYLDDALLAHMNSVRIIHGRGTGALKSGIHAYLKRQKFVKKFHLAEWDDGGDAITVVEFK